MLIEKRRITIALLCLLGVVLSLGWGLPATGCTAFLIRHDDTIVVGKSYDWSVAQGLLIVNPRGLHKTVALDGSNDEGTWVSRYGSITFNQYGRDFPQGGINEAGLVIEILWLAGTEFPAQDDRIALGTTQWIQFQLDTSGGVDEVLASLSEVRIESTVEVHFFVADRSGRSVTVEYLDGRSVCHTGDDLPTATLTNHTYEQSIAYLRRHEGWGGSDPIPQTSRSLDRFVRASTLAREYDPVVHRSAVDHAFTVLDAVAQGSRTQWNIAYELADLEVHFRTQEQRGVKSVDLQTLDFSCESPVLLVDLNAVPDGDLADHWAAYTSEANRRLITTTYRATEFLKGISDEGIDRVARYPDHAVCRTTK